MKSKKLFATILLVAFLIVYTFPVSLFAAVTNGYSVYQSSDMSTPATIASTLSDAFDYVNSHAAADAWVIKVSSSDLSIGSTATLNAPGTAVTLTSDSSVCTLSQTTAGTRHINVIAGSLVLENITLDGGSTGGGVSSASIDANIIMNMNATISNCRASQGGGVYSGGTLTLNSGSKISGCQSTYVATGGSGAGIYSLGRVILNEGSLISGNTANGGKGGGIAMCGTSAVLTMNDGEISGNRVTNYSTDFMGGGVVIYGGATFEMYNGTISGNSADLGGGVSIYDAGTIGGSNFTMYDGVISGNTATRIGSGAHGYGGGVLAFSWATNSFVMEGGEIQGNTAYRGGGISTYDTVSLAINHGSIYENTAVYGGGIYITGSASLNNDAQISGNTVSNGGGGIYAATGSSMTMNDNSSISGNTCTNGYGGGAYLNGSLVMNDNTEIKGNTCAGQGGGLFIYGSGTSRMNGGTIAENHAGISGGGVALWGVSNNCVFVMDATGSPKIYLNTAGSSGDDIHGNGTAMSITLISVADMALPPTFIADDWYYDLDSARYLDPTTIKSVYDLPLSGITGATDITLGILYTVTYDANSGVGSKSDTTASNSSYKVLSLVDTGITRAGSVFGGWNTSSDGSGTSYSAGDLITMTANISLYAQWLPITCNITFNSQGGSTVPYVTVPSGSTVTKPTDPTKTGSTFEGWYTDAAGTNPWDFNNKVTGDIELFAKWIPTTCTITFHSQGGSTVPSETVNYGLTATKPTDPTKTGNTFGGWYMDAACTAPWDFSRAVVTGNITLYAKWTAPATDMLTPSRVIKTGEEGISIYLLIGIATLSISLGLSVVILRRQKAKKLR